MLAERSSDPLTFTSLASEAQVSRRTLYTHWGTIEKVISDAVTLHSTEAVVDISHLPPRERMTHFLEAVRRGIHEPVTAVALASLVNQATHDSKAGESLVAMGETRMDQFRASVAPITTDQYSQLVGPIFLAEFVNRAPASDELIAQIVDHGVAMLGLEG